MVPCIHSLNIVMFESKCQIVFLEYLTMGNYLPIVLIVASANIIVSEILQPSYVQ